jgi:hypothetical protein
MLCPPVATQKQLVDFQEIFPLEEQLSSCPDVVSSHEAPTLEQTVPLQEEEPSAPSPLVSCQDEDKFAQNEAPTKFVVDVAPSDEQSTPCPPTNTTTMLSVAAELKMANLPSTESAFNELPDYQTHHDGDLLTTDV